MNLSHYRQLYPETASVSTLTQNGSLAGMIQQATRKRQRLARRVERWRQAEAAFRRGLCSMLGLFKVRCRPAPAREARIPGFMNRLPQAAAGKIAHSR